MVASSNSDSVPRRSDTRTYQFLRVADPQFAGHQLREERVTQGGERSRFDYVLEPLLMNRSHYGIKGREDTVGWCYHQESLQVGDSNVAESRCLLIPRYLDELVIHLQETVVKPKLVFPPMRGDPEYVLV